MWLLEHNAVHVLATDAHDDKNRPPILSEARDAVSKQYGPDVARALVLDNPAAIVAGQPLPIPRHTPSRDTETNERVKTDRNRRGPLAS
jgi:protein-tyrosine phosphatase